MCAPSMSATYMHPAASVPADGHIIYVTTRHVADIPSMPADTHGMT